MCFRIFFRRIIKEKFILIQYTLAGRGQRLAASLLDNLLVGILGIFLGFIIFIILLFVDSNIIAVASNIAEELLFTNSLSPQIVFNIFFHLYFYSIAILYLYIVFTNGQTWGKKLLKIKVMNQDGSVCTRQHYIYKRTMPLLLLASIAWILNVLYILISIIIYLNILMIFRKTRRCWHDDFAKTMVVKV